MSKTRERDGSFTEVDKEMESPDRKRQKRRDPKDDEDIVEAIRRKRKEKEQERLHLLDQLTLDELTKAFNDKIRDNNELDRFVCAECKLLFLSRPLTFKGYDDVTFCLNCVKNKACKRCGEEYCPLRRDGCPGCGGVSDEEDDDDRIRDS